MFFQHLHSKNNLLHPSPLTNIDKVLVAAACLTSSYMISSFSSSGATYTGMRISFSKTSLSLTMKDCEGKRGLLKLFFWMPCGVVIINTWAGCLPWSTRMWDMTFRNCLMDQKRCCIMCTCCLAACPEATCYLYWIVGDGRDICGQQDEDGSSILPLGLEVFLCGEVYHFHDDAAAGQHRLVCWACLRPQDGSTATWTHK